MLVQWRQHRGDRHRKPVTGSGDRLASLDVFRGAAVAGMILVNNPGNWNTTFETLTHADWNGCTFADLCFPSSFSSWAPPCRSPLLVAVLLASRLGGCIDASCAAAHG